MRTAAGGYLPIAEHGLIGDLHTAALVGTDGTIDWYCSPRFDSPSVFAAILDRVRGGYWRIAPAAPGWTSKQLYFPDTNTLITRFLSADGVGEVQDFVPIASSPAHPPHCLIRRGHLRPGTRRVRDRRRATLRLRPPAACAAGASAWGDLPGAGAVPRAGLAPAAHAHPGRGARQVRPRPRRQRHLCARASRP